MSFNGRRYHRHRSCGWTLPPGVHIETRHWYRRHQRRQWSCTPTTTWIFSYSTLIVHAPCMLTLRAFVKDSTPFIHRPQLDCIVPHFFRITSRTRFPNRCPRWFIRLPQRLLFFIRFCPQGRRPCHGVGCARRQLGEIRQVRFVRANVAKDETGAVHTQNGTAIGAEWPLGFRGCRHAFVVGEA